MPEGDTDTIKVTYTLLVLLIITEEKETLYLHYLQSLFLFTSIVQWVSACVIRHNIATYIQY